jgi:REP element-mobilizing transposase RayT
LLQRCHKKEDGRNNKMINFVKKMDNKFNNKYRIPSTRAVFHDYNSGVYFVTICTKNREHYFGKIERTTDCEDVAHNISTPKNGENSMLLSEIGEQATKLLQNISVHNPYAKIPLWVVMPNHIHAIVIIDDDDKQNNQNISTKTNEHAKMAKITERQSLLAFAIRSFKSAITKFANENNIVFAWQNRFHDHIIRNQNEMNNIATYIETNIANWNTDEFNI